MGLGLSWRGLGTGPFRQLMVLPRYQKPLGFARSYVTCAGETAWGRRCPYRTSVSSARTIRLPSRIRRPTPHNVSRQSLVLTIFSYRTALEKFVLLQDSTDDQGLAGFSSLVCQTQMSRAFAGSRARDVSVSASRDGPAGTAGVSACSVPPIPRSLARAPALSS